MKRNFHNEQKGSIFLRNNGTYVPDNAASHPTKQIINDLLQPKKFLTQRGEHHVKVGQIRIFAI
jgi:hypothetical protein